MIINELDFSIQDNNNKTTNQKECISIKPLNKDSKEVHLKDKIVYANSECEKKKED